MRVSCGVAGQGIAVSEERGQEACWRYLPADELDLHPEVRLV